MAIVDEIELHLHLAMQQDVLERLLNTFPSMQFVVSTHAPMVLSNLKQEASHKLYVLQRSEAGYEHELLGSDVYGEDISAIAQVIMGVSERTIGVQRLIDYVQEAINTKDADNPVSIIQSETAGLDAETITVDGLHSKNLSPGPSINLFSPPFVVTEQETNATKNKTNGKKHKGRIDITGYIEKPYIYE